MLNVLYLLMSYRFVFARLSLEYIEEQVNTNFQGEDAQYIRTIVNPVFGLLADKLGMIYNLRFYNPNLDVKEKEIKPGNNEQMNASEDRLIIESFLDGSWGRVYYNKKNNLDLKEKEVNIEIPDYLNDTSEDPLTSLIIKLFPSPKGQLTVFNELPENSLSFFKFNQIESVKFFAKLFVALLNDEKIVSSKLAIEISEPANLNFFEEIEEKMLAEPKGKYFQDKTIRLLLIHAYIVTVLDPVVSIGKGLSEYQNKDLFSIYLTEILDGIKSIENKSIIKNKIDESILKIDEIYEKIEIKENDKVFDSEKSKRNLIYTTKNENIREHLHLKPIELCTESSFFNRIYCSGTIDNDYNKRNYILGICKFIDSKAENSSEDLKIYENIMKLLIRNVLLEDEKTYEKFKEFIYLRPEHIRPEFEKLCFAHEWALCFKSKYLEDKWNELFSNEILKIESFKLHNHLSNFHYPKGCTAFFVSKIQHFPNLSKIRLDRLDKESLNKLQNDLPNCKKLKNIFFERVCIELPENFGNLTNLETLILRNCSLKNFPESFSKLKNLKSLNLIGNNLDPQVLNDALKNLINLEELILPFNLTEIPNYIQNFKKLKILFLGFSQPTTIPSEFNEVFQNLDEFEIDGAENIIDIPGDKRYITKAELQIMLEKKTKTY